MKLRVIAFWVLLFGTGEALAQSQVSQNPATSQPSALDPSKRISQYVHTAWRIQDGVLPGLPEAITQTTDGYLWIGTYAGLVRFDGVRFVPWEGPEGQHLPDSQIFAVLGARDGSLWIGTSKGVARWKDGELITLPYLGGRANSIIEDHHGTIWVGRVNGEDTRGGLCQIVGNDLKFYGESDGVSLTSANRLVEDDAGNLWLGGYQGLCRWKPGSSETYFQKELKTAGLLGVWALAAEKDGTLWAGMQLSGSGLEIQRLIQGRWSRYLLPGIKGEPGVTALFVDRDQSIWIGTARRGIYRVHGSEVDHFGSGDGLTSDAIAGFFQDREGTLWVATSKGVDRFRDLRVVTFSLREGLSADSVSSVQATRDGTVWIGNSGALNVLKDGKLSAIRTGQGLPGRDITGLFEDHTGRLWVGIDRGLWIYDGGKFRLIDRGIVGAITEDTDGTIWARMGMELVRIENLQVQERLSLPQIPVTSKLAPDPAGGIWLGLRNGDLVRYRDGQLETFPASQDSKSGIRALVTETDGSVWAATRDGLIRWKGGSKRLLTTRNGLPCDDIYTLVNDGDGSLWLYANCGVVALARAELENWWAEPDGKVNPRIFDGFDGAQPGLSPMQPQASRSTDGRLWFANDSVLQMIDPARLGANPLPPPVHIERLIADRKSYSARELLNLPPLTRDLEIDYTALSLVVPQKVRYRYKLEGHDQDWQEPGTRRQAFYNDLPPGNYRFRVIACNNDGVWNEEGATVEFNILPAFYQTNWFMFLCAAAATCLIWAAYKWRVRWIAVQLDRRFEERLAERTRIAQDLHDTLLQGVLSASMQLHVANDQLAEDAPSKPMVRRVLELMERVVNEGRNALRGLRSSEEGSDDLDQAFSRVSQELAVYREVDFRIIVEGQSRALHPMIRDEIYRIGREAIINAFSHSEAKNIEVEVKYATHELRVLVRDNGCGIDAQVLRLGRDGHFGLSGMRERAEKIGAKLKVLSRPGSGTEVDFFISGKIAFRTPASGEKRRLFMSSYPRRVETDGETRGREKRQ
ncbi:MAG TPA: two-component regulator propeller domain-containing protein [Blastocatellia bacterium]|nr:two-component regulator propeller domain-containing protein [Blastocatellia bacterium]